MQIEQVLTRWFKFPPNFTRFVLREKNPHLSIIDDLSLIPIHPPPRKNTNISNTKPVTSTRNSHVLPRQNLQSSKSSFAKGGLPVVANGSKALSTLPPPAPTPQRKKRRADITCTLTEPETNMIGGGGAAGGGVHYGRLMAAIYHWKKLATPSEWAITGPVYRNNYRSIDTKGRWLAACLPACLHCRHAHITPQPHVCVTYTGCPARGRRSNDRSFSRSSFARKKIWFNDIQYF